MKPIPPLAAITTEHLNGGFVHNVYFTFTDPKEGEYYVNDCTLRARISITGFVERRIAEQLAGIAPVGSSPADVVAQLCGFDAPDKIMSHIVSVASQIEAGEGPDTRRSDELFED